MGEGTAADEIDAGGCDGGEAFHGDAAAGFQLDPGATRHGHAAGHFVERHVVEQDEIDAAEGEEAFDLFRGIRFDFDFHVRVKGVDAVDACLQFCGIACCHEVIVLDHDHIVEAAAVVGSAAGADGCFFEPAPARCGFAGVENAGFGAGEGIRAAAGLGGDPAEALEEIESRAFACENAAGRSFQRDDLCAGGHNGSVAGVDRDMDGGVECCEDRRGGFRAREDPGFARDDHAAGAAVGWHKAGGSDISGPDVLGEGHADEFVNGVGKHAGDI
jgi:hypothetical protein